VIDGEEFENRIPITGSRWLEIDLHSGHACGKLERYARS
jgi:hypothetical protein